MKSPRTLLTAVLLAATSLGAQAQSQPEPGPYLVLAAGRAQYDYDCWHWTNCDSARAGMSKIGGGWRFGVWALEGWIFDLGKAGIRPSGDRLRMNGGAITAAWYLPFNAQLEGLLRAGLADVRQSRTGDATRNRYAAIGGLGLVGRVAPAVGLEVGFDVTSGAGRRSGTTTGSALSVGVRVGF